MKIRVNQFKILRFCKILILAFKIFEFLGFTQWCMIKIIKNNERVKVEIVLLLKLARASFWTSLLSLLNFWAILEGLWGRFWMREWVWVGEECLGIMMNLEKFRGVWKSDWIMTKYRDEDLKWDGSSFLLV